MRMKRDNKRKERQQYREGEKSKKLSRIADRLIKQAELNRSLKNFKVDDDLLNIFDEDE